MSVASVINLKHVSLDAPKSEDREYREDYRGPGFLLQSPWCAICQPLSAIDLIQTPTPAAFIMSCSALLRRQPIRTRICDAPATILAQQPRIEICCGLVA